MVYFKASAIEANLKGLLLVFAILRDNSKCDMQFSHGLSIQEVSNLYYLHLLQLLSRFPIIEPLH